MQLELVGSQKCYGNVVIVAALLYSCAAGASLAVQCTAQWCVLGIYLLNLVIAAGRTCSPERTWH
jgi:hypothetical protein